MFVNFETTGHHSIRFNPNLYNDGKVTQQRKSRLTEELRILTVAAQIIISFFFLIVVLLLSHVFLYVFFIRKMTNENW